MKLWYRDLSLGSPINGFLSTVRWEGQASGDGGTGAGAGSAGNGSGDGQAGGGQGSGQGAGSGEGGQAANAGGADWRSGLDPEIKDHPCLKDFKSEKEAVKAYVSAQKLIGVDKLPLPPKDAKPEVREQFLNTVFDRLGRPKEAKEYKITDVKLPDGIDLKTSPEAIEALKVEAHKLGLLPNQLDGLYKWYMTDAASKLKAHGEAQEKAKQDAEASLRQEMGAAYQGKLAKASQLLQKFAGDDYKNLIESGFGNNPAVIRFMAKMAESISEDTFTKGSGEATMTPQEALKEIPTVQKKLQEMDQSNPEYKPLLERKKQLYAMAYPN